MGKPSKPAAVSDSKRRPKMPERYTDEPVGSSSSAIPLLIHTDYDEDTRGPDEELPGYSDGNNSDEEAGDDEDGEDSPPPFQRYQPVVKKIRTKLGMGDTLTVSHDPHLNTDGEALYRWLKEESLVPPSPEIRISGHHSVRRRNGDKTETSTVTDFDLKLSLRDYLLEGRAERYLPVLRTVSPDKKTNRGGRWKSRATIEEQEEGRTVRSWADRYCEDKSTLKEFIMKKTCEGWDQTLLKNELEGMIRATNYRGKISIDFPVFETRVEVFPDNRISQMRKNEYWRWFFYLTFLWIFVWPYLWFFTKRYHVAETVWHYSMLVRLEHGSRREYVHTEQEWLQAWGPAIKRAAKAKRHGDVTEHDIDEISERAELGETRTVRSPKTGNSTIDGALGFLAGVGSIANDMRLSRSEVVGWGGDESW